MKRIFIFINLFLLISCSSLKNIDKDNDKIIFERAISHMENNRFYNARTSLEKLESEFPFSDKIDEAEMLIAFISYLNKEYDTTMNYLDKFIKLRPANKYIEYIYYLRALTSFQKSNNYQRDQSESLKARNYFREIILRFPDSIYLKDINNKLNILTNKLAAHQLEIANYYASQKSYLAALITLNNLLTQYPNTKYSEEIRFREIEILTIIGLEDIRNYKLEKINKLYPESKWTNYANQFKRS